MHTHHKLKYQEPKEKPEDNKRHRESSIYSPVYLLETNSDNNGHCEQESHLDNTLFSQHMNISWTRVDRGRLWAIEFVLEESLLHYIDLTTLTTGESLHSLVTSIKGLELRVRKMAQSNLGKGNWLQE